MSDETAAAAASSSSIVDESAKAEGLGCTVATRRLLRFVVILTKRWVSFRYQKLKGRKLLMNFACVFSVERCSHTFACWSLLLTLPCIYHHLSSLLTWNDETEGTWS